MQDKTDTSVFTTYGGPLNLDLRFKRLWLGCTSVLATDYLADFEAGQLAGLVLPVDSLDDIHLVAADVAESGNRIVIIDNAEGFLHARERGQFAISLCANYKTIEDKLDMLYLLRKIGVRVFSMSTNTRNLLADGVGERMPSGLSHLGVKVVKHLADLDILIDVSHLSEPSFWDVVNIVDKPIIATHSNAQGVCGNPRNLSDDQIKAIAERGGVIGISTYPTLVAEESPSLEILLRHIDYIVELGGIDCVAIGTDFVGFLGALSEAPLLRSDPTDTLYRKRTEQADSITPGLEGFREVRNLVSGLKKNGYSSDHLESILWKNFTRLIG